MYGTPGPLELKRIATKAARFRSRLSLPPNPPHAIPPVQFSMRVALCVVQTSMTTVGYGDMYPVTGLGQVIAMIAMISG